MELQQELDCLRCRGNRGRRSFRGGCETWRWPWGRQSSGTSSCRPSSATLATGRVLRMIMSDDG